MAAFTVAVPTRNRRDVLLGGLDAVVGQLAPGDELLVVDNGSSDGTGEAAARVLDATAASWRVVVEPRGGVARARNLALTQARTEVICFLDDDVRAEPGWLDSLRGAWERAGDRTACIGGPMLPEWGGSRPDWLADYLLYVISVLDLGPERRRLDQAPGTGHVWGGNFSLRVEPAQELGGFDTSRGARPEAPLARGEEEDIQRRLAAAGWEIWYEPGAGVRHLIPPERLTEEFFMTAFRARGRAEAARGASRARGLEALGRGLARYVLLRARRRPEAVTARFTCAYGWSLLTGRRARDARPPAAAL